MSEFIQIGATIQGAASRANYCPNPQFGSGLENGWGWDGLPYWSIDGSPPVALPAGCASSAKLSPNTTSELWTGGDYFPVQAQAGTGFGVFSCYVYRPGGYAFTPEAHLYAGGAADIWTLDLVEGSPTTGFARYAAEGNIGATTQALFRLKWHDNAVGRYAWVTGFMVDALDELQPYGDGDSDGWSWSGAAHNSASFAGQPARPVFHVGCDDEGLFISVGNPSASQFEVRRDESGVLIAALDATAAIEEGGGD